MEMFLPNGAPLHSIEAFLSRFISTDDDRLTISFHPTWVAVHPMVLAIVACAARRVKARGGDINLPIIPNLPTLPYFIRMGLFDVLEVPRPKQISEHESAGRFIPLTQIKTKEDLSQFIVDMIPLLHAEEEEVAPIKYVISELVRNALEHSGSPVGAFVCAQYYRDKKRLSLGVADAGIGVFNHMRTFHPVATDHDAIMLALRPGITGTTARVGGTDYNAGGGLFFTKSIACVSKKNFVLFSGDTMFKLRKVPAAKPPEIQTDPVRDIATVRSDFSPWPGTALGIDFSVGSETWFRDLLREINRHYSLGVENTRSDRYRKPRFE